MRSMHSLFSRLVFRVLASHIVKNTYRGLTGNALDSDETAAYVRIGHAEGYAEVVARMSASDAGFDAALVRYEKRLNSLLSAALLNPVESRASLSGEELEGNGTAALRRNVRNYIETDAHWRNQFKAHAGEILETAIQALLDRRADGDDRRAFLFDLVENDGLGKVLSGIVRSDEHWRTQVQAKAPELSRTLLGSFLGRLPQQHEVEDAVELLVMNGELSDLTNSLSRSPGLWEEQLSRHAEAVVRALSVELADPPFTEKTLARLTRHLRTSRNLTSLISELKSTSEYRGSAFELIAPELLRASLQALLHENLPGDELSRVQQLLSPDNFASLVGGVLSALTETRVEPSTNLQASVTDLVNDQILGSFREEEPASAVRIGSGFYDVEADFVWSNVRSKLLVKDDVQIYIACSYLAPGQKRVVSVFDGHKTQTIVLDNPFACHEIRFTGKLPRIVSFSSDGALNPKREGLSIDGRNLSFQIFFSEPKEKFLRQKPPPRTPIVLFVADEKKEIDSLSPIYKKLLADNYFVQMLDLQSAINYSKANQPAIFGYVISSAAAYIRLFNAGCRGSFIYVEHGVSPMKRYTYGAHYQQYDLALLPGRVWTERLERMYPQMQGRCEPVGYPKLQEARQLDIEAKQLNCARLGLDPSKPIVLFAPTWSDGNPRCGIFNLQHFDADENLLAIPHDGDMQHAELFIERGYRVFRPMHGESISDYYHLADVLVSDISSTAIEFASIGKPVVCLILDSVPDVDPAFIEGPGRLRIPGTTAYWDFCEWSTPEDLTQTLAKVKEGSDAACLRTRKERVREIISCCGDEALNESVNSLARFFERKRSSYFPRDELMV
jgi:hypothetical protein